MKITKLYLPLIILGIIQIGTAVFFMLPDFIVEAVGFKTVKLELSVYQYVICSLYFSLGVLYILGAFIAEIRFSALVIVCIDIPLEVLSYWAGFPHMLLPYWLIFLFSIIIAIPCIFCFLHLKAGYSIANFKGNLDRRW
jgi:hypothetical protein